MSRTSIPAAYFDQLYRARPDPWDLAGSDYEAQKYAATLEALPRQRFARGLEVGCSIGMLSALLAPRCGEFVGIDYAEAPLTEARRRCPQGAFHRMAAPGEWPQGRFDLIMLSEVLYYLGFADLDALARRCEDSLAPGGMVLLVNWRGENDGTMSGDAAALGFLAALPAHWPARNLAMEPRYRMDLAEEAQSMMR